MLQKLSISVIYLMLLASIVFSADIDFTGIYSDKGIDIDNNGKYDFLNISIGLDVKQAGEYDLYGVIEKNGSNYVEARRKIFFQSTGNKKATLSFDGREIYLNKKDGPYNLFSVRITRSTQQGFPEEINSLNNAYQTGLYHYTDFDRFTGSAAVYCTSSPCVAESSLIRSRDSIDVAEPNSPNTIDGCKDGTEGFYMVDESIENITITSFYGDDFRQGDKVDVRMTVYCDSASDRLNFVYTNDTDFPKWEVVDVAYCGRRGLVELSTEFYLDNNEGNHTIRGVFQNSGSGSAKGTCSSSDYSDNDDVSFFVGDAICYDFDGDGYGSPDSALCEYTGLDCADGSLVINPGQKEVCWNGIDDNCNELTDYDDPECRKNSISLKEGWNLISIPYDLDDDNIGNALSSIAGNYEGVYTYIDGEWKAFIPSDISGSNLDKIEKERGYWIDMNSDDTLYISGTKRDVIVYDLLEGWNLISYPSNTSKEVDEVFAGVIGNYKSVLSYQDGWMSYSSDKNINLLDKVKFDSGLFVYSDKNQTWKFDEGYKAVDNNLRYKINLVMGWNLFSVPVVLRDNSIGSALGSIEGCYDVVWSKEGNVWISTDNFFSPLDRIDNEHGYSIHMNKSCTLDVSGEPVSSINLSLNEGWNLISWPIFNSKDIDLAFSGLNYSIVWSTEKGIWRSTEDIIDSLKRFEPTKGYQIYMRKAANITISN